jgi:hypothetical protein
MQSANFPLGILQNPLTKSLYNERFEETLISPGASQFIATEDLLKITTEGGVPLVTEG